MKTKLYKNIFFIALFLFVMISIAVFNYGMDPYFVFKDKTYMNPYLVPRNYIHIQMKAYKYSPYNTILIGSSNTASLFGNYLFSHYFNKIYTDYFSYEQQYNLLKDYLYLHPETKKAYIIVCYPSFVYQMYGTELPKIKGKNFNIKELFFLFLSKDTFMKSIEFFKNKKSFQLTDSKKPYILGEEAPSTFVSWPYRFADIDPQESILKKLKEDNFKYLKKIAELLKSKNIDYTFVIPPHHAIFQAKLENTSPFLRETIDDCQRLLVQISDNDVYNFSIINKYTDHNLNNNFLYEDLIHVNYIMGMKIFKALYYNIPEKNLYVKLNKNNIEKEIQKNHSVLSKYIKDNKAIIDRYIYHDKYFGKTDSTYTEVKSLDKAPAEIKQEMDFYTKKAKEINNFYKQNNYTKMDLWNTGI